MSERIKLLVQHPNNIFEWNVSTVCKYGKTFKKDLLKIVETNLIICDFSFNTPFNISFFLELFDHVEAVLTFPSNSVEQNNEHS